MDKNIKTSIKVVKWHNGTIVVVLIKDYGFKSKVGQI